MTEPAERWIVVCRWDEFQHYKDRAPTWIKNYVRLVNDDDYLALSPGTRGVLHGLWIMFAEARGVLSESRASHTLVPRAAHAKHWRRHLTSLSDAGFIALVASKPVPIRYGSAIPEKEVLRTSFKERASARAEERSRSHANHDRHAAAVYRTAEAMTRNIGRLYPLDAYRDELAQFDLTATEATQLEALWNQLTDDNEPPL
jgi:hypothetical protein